MQTENIIESLLFAHPSPLGIDKIIDNYNQLAPLYDQPLLSKNEIYGCINRLQERYRNTAMEIKETASGFRFVIRQQYSPWISKLLEEKPARYSRAMLETLALIAYKQPITRGEIEEIRGVAVSSQIIKTLSEREWIRVIGHRDVPGKPALYATTRHFLDYFSLKKLDELPPLSALMDFDQINPELDLAMHDNQIPDRNE